MLINILLVSVVASSLKCHIRPGFYLVIACFAQGIFSFVRHLDSSNIISIILQVIHEIGLFDIFFQTWLQANEHYLKQIKYISKMRLLSNPWQNLVLGRKFRFCANLHGIRVDFGTNLRAKLQRVIRIRIFWIIVRLNKFFLRSRRNWFMSFSATWFCFAYAASRTNDYHPGYYQWSW